MSESTMQAGRGPLSGIRVLDLSAVIAGPLATQILADYGAEVIRIETSAGDVMRHVGPMRSAGMGHQFLQLGRNKKSVVLDLKQPASREALERLVRSCDAVVTNMRLDASSRLGIDAATCLALNPRLVYLRVSGFDSRGRYRDNPAYDDVIQALSGLAMLFASTPGTEPRFAPLNLADRLTGLTAAQALMAALFHRERTGLGQEVEVPMFESVVAFLLGDHMAGAVFEPPEGPPGYARVLAASRRPHRTRDGYLCVLPYQDKHWQQFFEIAGHADTHGRDVRFATLTERARHIDELYALVGAILRTRDTAAWLEQLGAAGIPCAPVNRLEEVLTDAHLGDIGFFRSVAHPTEGTLRMPGVPVRFGGLPLPDPTPAPRIGEHTAEVLRELGYANGRIDGAAGTAISS